MPDIKEHAQPARAATIGALTRARADSPSVDAPSGSDLATQRHNNFGLIRLCLATLVILSHAPEIIDGDRHRELLTQIFGTLSFGEFAVDGFFLISGFLITKSMLTSPNGVSFLTKRILRIVPGFMVAFWICVLIIAPCVDGHEYNWPTLKQQIFASLHLAGPVWTGEFQNRSRHSVNGSLWMIAYEFRCYMITFLLYKIGAFQPRARRAMAVGLVCLLIFNAMHLFENLRIPGEPLFGRPAYMLRFFTIYAVGSAFYLNRARIPYKPHLAALAALCLVLLMFVPKLAEDAVAIFGGYVMLWMAQYVRQPAFARFTSHIDLSYGVYLYAWPVQCLILWFSGLRNPWLACMLTVLMSAPIALASWKLIEEPAIAFGRRRLLA